MNETDIRKRLEALRKEREEFYFKANLQVAALDGAIAELEKLLKSAEAEAEASDEAVVADS